MKYNPAFLSPEDLVRQFVVRHTDLDTVLQTVRENTTGANQHVLVIGPRGSGKTMLVRRVAAEISRDSDLHKCWYPVMFAEESYQVTTPGEFWLEAILHLGQQTKDPRWQAKYEEYGAHWQDEDTMRERAFSQLMAFAGQERKRLLLIVENFDALLGDQLSDDHAWTLRHTLQNEPKVMLLATAVSRFEEISQANKAMYELFRPHHLRPLDRDECRVLWKSLTGQLLEGDRVRPIEILTGGNVRLLTILSTFGAHLSLRQLMGDLVHLVDEHTEYFKSHLETLPATERKVYLALVELWDPSTAHDVADAARLGVSQVSSLLRRLADRGAVVTLDGTGRTKWYQVAERMYNIYYLFRRRGSPAQRVRAVVRFMINFYQPEQLVAAARHIADEASSLESSDRQDHYYFYCNLVDQISTDSVRNELVKVARDRFAKFDDIPDQLARMIRSPTRVVGASAAVNEMPGLPTKVIADLREEVWAHLRESRIMEGEKACRRLVKAAPQSAEAWTLLGMILVDKPSCLQEAEQAFQKAIAIDPQYAWAWRKLGDFLHMKLSRFDEAERAYRKAIEIDPQVAWAWAQLGALLHKKLSRFDEAEQAYRKAIEIDPRFEWAWVQLGDLLHKKLSRFDEAEQAYRKAIDIAPQFDWAWAHLGELLHEKLSRFDEAEQAYRKAIEIDPQYAWAWAHLGQLLHENLSRFDEAEQAYRKAIEIDPQYAWAWAHLGQLLHEKLSRFDEAEQAYRKANALEPGVAWGWARLGDVLNGGLSRFDEAEQAYSKAIDVEPQNPNARIAMLRFLLSRPERRQEVLRFAETAIADVPNNGWLLNQCARLLYKIGEMPTLERALQWAEQTVAIAPNNVRYYHTLASVQCALGNCQDALKSAGKYLADEDTVIKTIDDAVELFVELAARGQAAGALQVLMDSPSREQLEPLSVGVRIFLGEDVKVAAEVKEIGGDVARRIESRRDELRTG
jgi:tetratricopeptide (TPR) repeat protein/ABC-type iron transport system FetAB ATPase subunit